MPPTKNPIDILKFWHMVEFFVPFDLDEIVSKSNAKYVITENQLTEYGNNQLPWLSTVALIKAGGKSSHNYRYNLYLLPFDKSELSNISKQVFSLDENIINHIEFEEKFDDEGLTCFAKLAVDNTGKPNLDKISLSTLPWALGKLQQLDYAALNSKHYNQELKKLSAALNLLSSHLSNTHSKVIADFVAPGVLTASSLLILIQTLKKWAGFSPDYPISIVFEIQETKLKIEKPLLEKPPDEQTAVKTLENSTNIIIKKDSKESSQESETNQLDILNSFFIEDLEKVVNDISNKHHTSIDAYLSGVHKENKIDLYLKKNSFSIIQKLQPQNMNHGRWPAEDSNFMSLMQQFAINECFYPTNTNAIFSVNGPPGTGKTTLLQDIIAENIVQRARALSKFASTHDTFRGTRTIKFSSQLSCNIGLLDERLTGFEMLVASSNNTAVENISKELPLKKKIPEKYKLNCNYITSVAAKVFADHKDKAVIPLSTEEKPWGLISVALGNSKNRNRFSQRVFFAPEDKEIAKERIAAGEYLTIWEWRKQYTGPTFQQAKQDFTNTDTELCTYLKEIEHFAELYQSIADITPEAYCQNEHVLLETLQLKEQEFITQEIDIQRTAQKLKRDKEQISLDLKQCKQFKPGLIERLFRTITAKNYEAQRDALMTEWKNLSKQEREFNTGLENIQSALIQLKNDISNNHHKLATKIEQYQKHKNEYAVLANKFADLVIPPKDNNLETDNVQLRAFWQNETLNALRTKLYICALNLHEAWLADALNKRLFTQNLLAISYMLNNNRPLSATDEIYIWQSFFMWIPVVSSTFASIARQFKNIGSQELGWLFIDEAGQAIPQAAVGAIWRAKNTLVVGDPLQIEPVFTIPPNLIEGLARYSLTQDYEKWLPTLASVQTLADDANKLGASVEMTTQQWIGCPLRIHRRCLDPMFSVANYIAYDSKMLNHRTDNTISDNYPLGKSCWYNMPGDTTDKQYVQTQGELLLVLFAKLYEQDKQLPNIYIITPFKRIKFNLQKLIGDIQNWAPYLTTTCKVHTSQTLKKWCSTHIGTVHTFQGKEIQTVIIVLGADQKNQGAANWASNKPNLLNVALTRAKDRVYLIGDYQLWSQKKYFSALANVLAPIHCQGIEID